MEVIDWVTVGVATLNLLLLGWLVLEGEQVNVRAARMLLFVAALVLPVATCFAVMSRTVSKAREVTFCLSCHEMQAYGDSLKEDDDEMIPAVHAQNNLVHRDEACYSCHTDYTMFGPIKAKISGMRHVWVHYMGTIPEKIELYQPYNHMMCLNCHAGARRFEKQKAHRRAEGLLEEITSGAKSCLESGCHDVTHFFDDDEDEEEEE